jgi:hypothetical protein
MQLGKRSFGWLFTLLLVSGAAYGEVTNCTVIASVPYTISVKGIYCLTQSFTTTTANDAITVNADDVVIELNGHTLEGTLGPSTWARGIVAENRKNVTVRNGVVRGFRQGVSLTSNWPFTASHGYLVENMHADRNFKSGIIIMAHHSSIRNNRVTLTGGSTTNSDGVLALRLTGHGGYVGHNTVIETVDAAALAAIGLYMEYGKGSIIENNVFSNSALSSLPSTAIMPVNNSNGVTVVGNRVVNFRTGLDMQSGGLYMNNTVGGAVTPFSGGTAAGSTNFSY